MIIEKAPKGKWQGLTMAAATLFVSIEMVIACMMVMLKIAVMTDDHMYESMQVVNKILADTTQGGMKILTWCQRAICQGKKLFLSTFSLLIKLRCPTRLLCHFCSLRDNARQCIDKVCLDNASLVFHLFDQHQHFKFHLNRIFLFDILFDPLAE